MRRGEVSLVTYIKDVGLWMLLVLLVPLWMILAWASLVFIVARHLYWWARGNPAAVSKPRGRRRLAWAERRSFWGGGRLTSGPRDMTADRKPLVPVLVVAHETAPVSNR